MNSTFSLRFLLSAILLSGLLPVAATAASYPVHPQKDDESSQTIRAGGTKIVLPAPSPKFVPSRERFRNQINILMGFNSKMTLHEFFAIKPVNDKVRDNRELRRHFHCATNKMHDKEYIGKADFADFCAYLKSSIQSENKKVNRNRKAGNSGRKLLSSTHNTIAYRRIIDVPWGQDRVCVVGICNVKGKLVWIYGYSDYDSHSDIEWTEKSIKEWMQKIVSANKQ